MCADFFAHLRGRPDEITELESIRDNLNWLLNSRIGFLPHIKDYGIRDLSDVANHKTPREDLRRDIEKAIHRFEPRITALEVEEYEDSVESLKHFFAVFRIRFRLKSDPDDPAEMRYRFRLDGVAEPLT